MDRIDAMRVFCSVIEAGGFAAAADQLGISTSAVSRQVAQLEAHLNVRLLNRTTRRMSPTDEGFAYFERCTQLLADIEETEASVAGEARRPRGRLRLTAPMTLGILRLAPAFAAFSQQYPEITLDIVLSDNVADFTEEGLDMAIRVGRIGSENVVARHIGETALLIAAAPAYLERAGTPLTPDELTRHSCFTYAFSATGNHWEFVDAKGDPLSVRIGGPIKANSGMLLAEMAVAGSGIVYGPCFILLPMIERGLLVRLLPDWTTRRLPIHVVYPTRRHLSARVQAMTSFLTEWFASRHVEPNKSPA
ncbi:LysR family transcriptional regulator [Propionivibrio sp.]|uniref:LysR family transcriptional regulator n=1 Tax=Propionivibrio sp. TaxID=2212460 RepID=UPI0025E04666|nr:LysR family transcriptional regulator [Propionivibrio sp.]MBK7356613.1 LysR family transcriptional regulator [Propionivibrio sp.]MBK8744195.1 LysR family transcriptional regulator [Propionivibrio sp.]MBK8894312.1 LysR family transcriptional regulator [Propionivibrio sp.]